MPVKVAPSCSATVSPQAALLRASCRLSPAFTEIVLPGAGVLVMEVDIVTRGSSAGPSKLLLEVTSDGENLLGGEIPRVGYRYREVECACCSRYSGELAIRRQAHAGRRTSGKDVPGVRLCAAGSAKRLLIGNSHLPLRETCGGDDKGLRGSSASDRNEGRSTVG